MNKIEIKIPYGIEYISDWKDYNLPRGEHCIVDKGVTGCGYTEFALTNNDNVILCSPRKLLLENKSEKHLNDKNIFYLESSENFSKTFEERIEEHIKTCHSLGLPVKFMVTYDSMWRVSLYLMSIGEIENFIFVVDEFQSVFLDSYFKSEVEIEMVEQLQDCPNVIYLSATPMLEKYLIKLKEFRDLTFYKLDWSNTGFVETIYIGRKRTNALSTECAEIVENYLNGKFPVSVDKDNKVYQSKEAVFYFNSVEEILRVIRKCRLTPENTIVVCSKSPKNEKKLNKEGFTFGRIPLEGEQNPMFTFCTSAVYMGVDFYSNCASSYVFADPNVDCLALDISLDLPQIIGRQRDKSNPFKNSIYLFYKTKRNDEKKLTLEEFNAQQELRRKNTEILLSGFLKLSSIEQKAYLDKLNSDIELSQYSKDFVSISKTTGKPVYNSLIDIANERAWEVSQKEYQDTLSVTKAILSLENAISGEYINEDDFILKTFLENEFYKKSTFQEKMKSYCEFRDKYQDNPRIMDGLFYKITNPKYHRYYNYYGTEGCAAKRFLESSLYKGLLEEINEDSLKNEIYKRFKVGDRIASFQIKLALSEVYQKFSLSKSPKAKDLENYFKLVPTKITMPDKSLKPGFRLDSL